MILLATLLAVGAQENGAFARNTSFLIDEALGGLQRPFGRYPDTLSFGPTGAKLWVNYLEERPGFVGRIDFIHRTNIPVLFEIEVREASGPVQWGKPKHAWYPSHLRMTFASAALCLRETKFITWDDIAVDLVEIENLGSNSAADLDIRVTSDLTQKSGPAGLGGSREIHGETVHLLLATDLDEASETRPLRIPPGGARRFRILFGLSPDANELKTSVTDRLKDSEIFETHRREYQSWFDRVPTFASSDPYLNRLWAYRWYLVRRNLADPCCGRLRHPLYYEGRGHKMSNEPWAPRGWEFSKLIPFSTPFHILEGRWHPDASPCRGELANLIANQGEDGLFPYATIHRAESYYTDFIIWAAWQLRLVHPEIEFPSSWQKAFKRNLHGWFQQFDPDGNFLCHVTDHNRTGKEYQPSYWYFDDFPSDAKGAQKALLERVDLAAYLHLNAVGLAGLCRMAGDSRGQQEFENLAEKIREAVLRTMWDDETGFFYDVREEDKAKARVLNVVGFDPFFAGIADERHLGAWDHLLNPNEFWTAWPVPSVSIDCPAFAPDASWAGQHLKGSHGAMWNGPTWPFTNSTVLMSLAQATRQSRHCFDSRFGELLRRYSRLHFLDQDLDRPNILEHYNPFTGKPISEEEDYFHSSWIDLIVTCVAGLMPREDETVEIDPIDCGLDFFELRGLPYRGHRLDIIWMNPKSEASQEGSEAGLRLFVDGVEKAAAKRLEPLREDQ